VSTIPKPEFWLLLKKASQLLFQLWLATLKIPNRPNSTNLSTANPIYMNTSTRLASFEREKILSRREVIKHMANEMGGVHVAKSGSEVRDLLLEAEDKLIIQMKSGEIRGQYIEVLAIGQAVGRSLDLRNLAAKIRERLNAHSL
jgi:hypothetical protein